MQITKKLLTCGYFDVNYYEFLSITFYRKYEEVQTGKCTYKYLLKRDIVVWYVS